MTTEEKLAFAIVSLRTIAQGGRKETGTLPTAADLRHIASMALVHLSRPEQEPPA